MFVSIFYFVLLLSYAITHFFDNGCHSYIPSMQYEYVSL